MTPAGMAVVGLLIVAVGVSSIVAGVQESRAWPGAFNFILGFGIVIFGGVLLVTGVNA